MDHPEGVRLPGMGWNDVNADLPPAGEAYSHDAFAAGMETCPLDGCEGLLTRVSVVSETPHDPETEHLDTLEVTCRGCQRVLYKSEQVVYDHPATDD
jgi:hypothetical protein